MGQIAAALADDVIVTDDNPRTENAAMIRSAIMPKQKVPVKSATGTLRSKLLSPNCNLAMCW